MNILVLSSKNRWAGVVSWIVRLSVRLEENGHKVWIFSKKKSAFTRNKPENINLIPINTGMDYNPILILKLIFFIKRRKIDIVITNIKKEVIAGGIAAKLCKIPNIRLIGNERDFIKIKKLQQILVSHNILPCRSVKKLILEQNSWMDTKKLSVIHIGLNYKEISSKEIFEEKKRWKVSDDELIIGITGRVTKLKGVDFLVKAFSKIAGSYQKTKLVITGVGQEVEQFKDLVKELDLVDRVIFAGFAPDSLVSAASYDIAVLASRFEAFPYTVVEYFSVGSAVISTDVGGTSEIIKHNQNGLLIVKDNEKQMIESLILLIENPELRNKFKIEAKKSIFSSFSEDKMIEKTERLFQELI